MFAFHLVELTRQCLRSLFWLQGQHPTPLRGMDLQASLETKLLLLGATTKPLPARSFQLLFSAIYTVFCLLLCTFQQPGAKFQDKLDKKPQSPKQDGVRTQVITTRLKNGNITAESVFCLTAAILEMGLWYFLLAIRSWKCSEPTNSSRRLCLHLWVGCTVAD